MVQETQASRPVQGQVRRTRLRRWKFSLAAKVHAFACKSRKEAMDAQIAREQLDKLKQSLMRGVHNMHEIWQRQKRKKN